MIPRYAEALPSGHALEGYRIERVVRTTAFTVTYLAIGPDGLKVTLREYFPAPWAMRSEGEIRPVPGAAEDFTGGLARFRAEAKALCGFRHPGLVQALDYFEAHGTGYLVSAFVAGESLAARLAHLQTLPERAIAQFLPPLLDGLAALHAAGFVHGDVQPDTIILRDADGSSMLLDVATARHALARAADIDAAAATYAALDEYPEYGAAEGPWTDVYGVAATLYRCVAGARPIAALERWRDMAGGAPDPLIPAARAGLGAYAPELLAGIDAGLSLRAGERPQSIAALRALLGRAAGVAHPRPMMTGVRSSVTSAAPARRRSRAYAAMAAAAALAAFVAYHATKPPTGDEFRRADPARTSDSVMALHPGTIFRDCATCPDLVVVPAGRFDLGAAARDSDAADFERPQQSVAIARPFAMGRYEVTVAEYAACAAEGACANRGDHAPWGGGRMPVVKVTWSDAKAYAAWLAQKTGKSYRLPSEAEWEYAARAGTTRRFAWGNKPGRGRANCQDCGSGWDNRQAAPVGSFHANAFGLHDMLGNVWEWTEDCWTPSHAGAPADGAARPALAVCPGRVLRGGSFDLPSASIRVTNRSTSDAEVGEIYIGFRVARSLDAARAAAAR